MPDYNDLADLISQQLVGQQHDTESTLPERFKVDHLMDMARCVALGDIDEAELVEECRKAGVDISTWLQENFSD
jgi:hypothetical protein